MTIESDNGGSTALRGDQMLPVAGLLLVALCCAGPFLVAGFSAALVLTALRARFAPIILTLAVTALIAGILIVRTQRAKSDNESVERDNDDK